METQGVQERGQTLHHDQDRQREQGPRTEHEKQHDWTDVRRLL